MRIFRKLAQMLDVDVVSTPPSDGDALTYDSGSSKWVPAAAGGAGADDQTAVEVPFTPAGNLSSTDVQGALVELDTEKAATTHVHDGADITSGTVADARIASTIARDSEVTSAISALSTVYQPLDSDLTAIAALTTTSFGRGLLTLADAAALLAAAGAAAASHTHAESDITNLTTDLAGKQPLDSDLTAIAGLSPTNDDIVQRKAGAWTNRTMAQLISDLAALGTTFQPLDSDLTAIAALSTTSFGRAFLALADAAAARSAIVAAPAAAKYIVQTADSELSAEQALGALATGILKNTTTTGVLSIAAEGTDYYKPGGTDVALADGGTGASLTDPNADRIMFWDDSAGAVTWLTPGTNLTITGTTIDATAGSGTSPDDVSLIVHMEVFA